MPRTPQARFAAALIEHASTPKGRREIERKLVTETDPGRCGVLAVVLRDGDALREQRRGKFAKRGKMTAGELGELVGSGRRWQLDAEQLVCIDLSNTDYPLYSQNLPNEMILGRVDRYEPEGDYKDGYLIIEGHGVDDDRHHSYLIRPETPVTLLKEGRASQPADPHGHDVDDELGLSNWHS